MIWCLLFSIFDRIKRQNRSAHKRFPFFPPQNFLLNTTKILSDDLFFQSSRIYVWPRISFLPSWPKQMLFMWGSVLSNSPSYSKLRPSQQTGSSDNIPTQQYFQMVKIVQLLKHQKSDTQSINLSTSSGDKIHKIEGLERFGQLRSLNLANNMIARVQNVGALVNLRVLNLDFNQISRLENLRQLVLLEELSVSYNCLPGVGQQIGHNSRLKVFHAAYNDIRSLEDVRALGQLPSLAVLSLAGNPFLTALSYVSFIKLMIPSLLVLDSKDVNQPIMSACVHPHEEIFILRDALNKLIDERNSAYVSEVSALEESPIKEREEKSQLVGHKHSFGKPVPESDRQQFIGVLEEWIEGNSCKQEVKKIQISQLSDSYSRKIGEGKSDFQMHFQELSEKVRRYRYKEGKNMLSAEKRDKLAKMERELDEQNQMEERRREESKKMLATLKGKQTEYGRLKQKNVLLRRMMKKIEQDVNCNPLKLVLNLVLLGDVSLNINYKLVKRYMFYPKGVVQVFDMLNHIVFGQAADYERIVRLKEFLEDKSLIEIINNLKEMGLQHQKERKKYEKEKDKLIRKIEVEAQELCEGWKELDKQKWILKNSRRGQEERLHSEDKWGRVESEERGRISQLKKEKEHYQVKVEELRKNHEDLSFQFQRKYRELEQFQQFFEQFKKDRQIANNLKEQKEQLEQQLHNKRELMYQLQQNIKDLTCKEQILQEKSTHYQRKAFEKAQEVKLYQQKLKVASDKIKRINQEFNVKTYQLVQIEENLTKLMEESRQYEKKIERHRSSYQLFEEKLKNLSQIENNKKNTIGSMEGEIEEQRKRLKEVQEKADEVELKLNRNMELSYQYQTKIQEGKKSIESLTDINKTLADMMERQSQLKRSNMELQLQNQHLAEMRGKMLSEIKVRYDDEDENL